MVGLWHRLCAGLRREGPRKKLTEAARLFRERGFHNTSTRDIARAAGMSAGALYQFSYRAKNPPVAGIGYAAARELAREGAHVTLNGRTRARIVLGDGKTFATMRQERPDLITITVEIGRAHV